ncbi:SURF1 family protein [Streptomyces sp. NPDC059740]|uniref:SURF1 family protein n=1 Tax=Streptomyces sp. NPDC059740 TaxID=3346926 RepID=UPI0036585022
MYRFLLTPRWWGINLFALLAVPLCVLMGTWQLSRFEDRVDAQHQQEHRTTRAQQAAPEPVGRLLPVSQVTSGRLATARGRYDTGHQLLVPGRRLGEREGFYVLTLLRTDGGKALPVVRGWLPGDADDPHATAKVPAPPRGEVTVQGALQASESQDTDGAVSGGLPQGQLGMISAASLVNVVPYDVYDGWVTLTHPRSPLKPVPPAAPENSGLDLKAFQNLGYTGEWFVFAGFAVFMWFRLFRREAEAARDRALGIHPDPGPRSGFGVPPAPRSEARTAPGTADASVEAAAAGAPAQSGGDGPGRAAR